MSLCLWPWFYLALFLYFPSIFFLPFFFLKSIRFSEQVPPFITYVYSMQHKGHQSQLSFRQQCHAYIDNTGKLKSMFVKMILCFLYDGVSR